MSVFLSYSRRDKAIAHFLAYIFKIHDIPCLIDYKIRVGEIFDKRIKEMIKECDLVIYLLTESSQKSAWVQYEIGFADALEKEIWPITLHENIHPEGLIFRYQSYSLYDLLNSIETIDKLIQAVKSKIVKHKKMRRKL